MEVEAVPAQDPAPAALAVEAEAEAPKPAEEAAPAPAPAPAADAAAPASEEAPKPAEESPKPAEEAPKPAEETPKPSEEAASAAANGDKAEADAPAPAPEGGETLAGKKRSAPDDDEPTDTPPSPAKKAKISGEDDDDYVLVEKTEGEGGDSKDVAMEDAKAAPAEGEEKEDGEVKKEEEAEEKKEEEAEVKKEEEAEEKKEEEPPAEPELPQWFHSITDSDTCDICFQVERKNKREKDRRFVKCMNCGLLAHEDCYGPEDVDEKTRTFECSACKCIAAGKQPPKEEEEEPVTPKGKGKRSKKKPATPKNLKPIQSPGPFPDAAEAKTDGRLYPAPPMQCIPVPEGEEVKPKPIEEQRLDVFCRLCLRRDVVGGMKLCDDGSWCHMSCTLSTLDMYTDKDGLLTGHKKALARSEASQKQVMKETGCTSIACDACGLGGGFLMRCAYKPEKKKSVKKFKKKKALTKKGKKSPPKPEPEPEPVVKGPLKKCPGFIHPLCAEIADRARVIVEAENGDVIRFKCEEHSYSGKDLCMICNRGVRQYEMIECDGCSKGVHMGCLKPKLDKVPEGDFFCPKCLEKKYKSGELERPPKTKEEIVAEAQEELGKAIEELDTAKGKVEALEKKLEEAKNMPAVVEKKEEVVEKKRRESRGDGDGRKACS